MSFRRNFKAKYIIYTLFLGTILGIVFLSLTFISFENIYLRDAISTIKSKVFVDNLFEPPQECLDKTTDGYKWTCFRSYFEKITTEVSASAAIAEAIKLKAQRIVNECHLFAHFTGEINLEKYNFDVGKAFSTCTTGCNNGCFHGVLQRYIQSKVDLPDMASRIKNICDSLGTDLNAQFTCFHGVGHGLVAHNDLPLQNAIKECETFRDVGGEDICIGGIFMENMVQYIYLELPEDQLKEILPEICASIESTNQFQMYSCMYNITLGLMDYTGYDIERTKKLCEGLQEQEKISECKELIPTVVMTQAPSNINFPNFFGGIQKDTQQK